MMILHTEVHNFERTVYSNSSDNFTTYLRMPQLRKLSLKEIREIRFNAIRTCVRRFHNSKVCDEYLV